MKEEDAVRTTLASADWIKIIESICDTLEEQKGYLSDLDGAIGDGDHGVNMAKCFREVVNNPNILNAFTGTMNSQIDGIKADTNSLIRGIEKAYPSISQLTDPEYNSLESALARMMEYTHLYGTVNGFLEEGTYQTLKKVWVTRLEKGKTIDFQSAFVIIQKQFAKYPERDETEFKNTLNLLLRARNKLGNSLNTQDIASYIESLEKIRAIHPYAYASSINSLFVEEYGKLVSSFTDFSDQGRIRNKEYINNMFSSLRILVNKGIDEKTIAYSLTAMFPQRILTYNPLATTNLEKSIALLLDNSTGNDKLKQQIYYHAAKHMIDVYKKQLGDGEIPSSFKTLAPQIFSTLALDPMFDSQVSDIVDVIRLLPQYSSNIHDIFDLQKGLFQHFDFVNKMTAKDEAQEIPSEIIDALDAKMTVTLVNFLDVVTDPTANYAVCQTLADYAKLLSPARRAHLYGRYITKSKEALEANSDDIAKNVIYKRALDMFDLTKEYSTSTDFLAHTYDLYQRLLLSGVCPSDFPPLSGLDQKYSLVAVNFLNGLANNPYQWNAESDLKNAVKLAYDLSEWVIHPSNLSQQSYQALPALRNILASLFIAKYTYFPHKFQDSDIYFPAFDDLINKFLLSKNDLNISAQSIHSLFDRYTDKVLRNQRTPHILKYARELEKYYDSGLSVIKPVREKVLQTIGENYFNSPITLDEMNITDWFLKLFQVPDGNSIIDEMCQIMVGVLKSNPSDTMSKHINPEILIHQIERGLTLESYGATIAEHLNKKGISRNTKGGFFRFGSSKYDAKAVYADLVQGINQYMS
ncbi:hypothetical protein HGB07_07310 [Candidatus Roizmanbacteria bacterium]|nr:hypothetical protein [Candidatus Roizmanbacteria bacterium]